MAGDRDDIQERKPADDLAYTAPAEADSAFQYHTCLRPEPVPEQAKPRHGGFSPGLAVLALAMLLVAGLAALFLVRYDVSFLRNEEGFRLQVVRRRADSAAGSLSTGDPVWTAAPDAGLSPPRPNYQWNGATLDLTPSEEGGRLSYRQIYDKCASSVALVKAISPSGEESRGAGVIMSEDGAVIVSSRVILSAESITVTADGQDYAAYVIGLDYASDLAVVKIDAQGLRPAQFGASAAIMPGDLVLVLGNPVAGSVNIMDGMVASVDENYSYRGFPIASVQVTASLGAAAAGSPLVNQAGQVIGIINTDMAAQYPDSGGMNFAVPISAAKPIIDELLQNGFIAGRPASGLTVSDIPEAYAVYYQYPSRLYISAVRKDSPAYEAGVRRGDLILSANGIEVETTDALYAIINGMQAGDQLTLELSRERETGTVTFALMDAAQLANASAQ